MRAPKTLTSDTIRARAQETKTCLYCGATFKRGLDNASAFKARRFCSESHKCKYAQQKNKR